MEHREVTLDDDQVLSRVTFQFTPESLGSLELRVRVTTPARSLPKRITLRRERSKSSGRRFAYCWWPAAQLRKSSSCAMP